MVKICDDSIKKPLSITYKNCIKTGIYPNAWKKSNIVPVHKKGDKQIVNNYRPVSLLPIFGILRKSYLIPFLNLFKRIVLFVITNQVFDLLIYVSINYFTVHDIYESFDCKLPQGVRRIFLDISKAFDRIWHEGLI